MGSKYQNDLVWKVMISTFVNFWAGSEDNWAGISLFEGGCDVALFPITEDISHLCDYSEVTEWQ